MYGQDDELLRDLVEYADENDPIGATERLRNSKWDEPHMYPNNCNSMQRLLVRSTKPADRILVMSGTGMEFYRPHSNRSDAEWVLETFEVGEANCGSYTPPKWCYEKKCGICPSAECARITVSNSRPTECTEITRLGYSGYSLPNSYLKITSTPDYQAIFGINGAVGFVRYKNNSKKSYLVQPCAWTWEEEERLERGDENGSWSMELNWVVTRRKGLDVQIRTLSMNYNDVFDAFYIEDWVDTINGPLPELENLYKTVIAKPEDRKQVLRMPLFNALRRSLLLENIVKPWFMALREKVEMQRARDPVKKLVAAALEVVKSQLVLGLEPAAPIVGAKRKYERAPQRDAPRL